MLLLSALPNLNAEAAYLLMRTNRVTWLMAQIITMFIVTTLYVLLLLLSSVILGMGSSYAANKWSETATLLSYMPAGSEASIKVVRRAILLHHAL